MFFIFPDTYTKTANDMAFCVKMSFDSFPTRTNTHSFFYQMGGGGGAHTHIHRHFRKHPHMKPERYTHHTIKALLSLKVQNRPS